MHHLLRVAIFLHGLLLLLAWQPPPFGTSPLARARVFQQTLLFRSVFTQRRKNHADYVPWSRLWASSPENSDSNDETLSRRLEQLRAKEAGESKELLQALNRRVEEVQASEAQRAVIGQGIYGTDKGPTLFDLPVVVMDALLPMQTLQGRTDDPTFGRFLRDLGLGGCFVMTSLDLTQRKVRRHGVVVQIIAVDALRKDESEQNADNATMTDVDRWLQASPTAVDFKMVGLSRCRMVGPASSFHQRVGRWRRGYDPNGEESQLGWGDERFVDFSEGRIIAPVEPTCETVKILAEVVGKPPPSTEWSSIPILVNLESLEAPISLEAATNDTIQEKVEELQVLVDEWYGLASDPRTFENCNVTAATRIRRDHPGLWVDPTTLLRKVSQQLGPRPTGDDPNAFCIWAAAIINPLPPLGVSIEIRGRVLEAPTLDRRLQVLEFGLRRSIDNLTGRRPLI